MLLREKFLFKPHVVLKNKYNTFYSLLPIIYIFQAFFLHFCLPILLLLSV